MKPRILFLAATLATGLYSVAEAQQPPAAPQDNARPASTAPAVTYVAEPIASSVKKEGPEAEAEGALVQALNAEPSLQGSKITVAADKDAVLLTGVTMTKAQRAKASEIAIAQFGETKVVNAILPSEA